MKGWYLATWTAASDWRMSWYPCLGSNNCSWTLPRTNWLWFLSPDPTYNSTETNSIIEGSVDIYDLIRWVGIDVEYIHSIGLSHQLKPDSIQPTTCTLTSKCFFFFFLLLFTQWPPEANFLISLRKCPLRILKKRSVLLLCTSNSWVGLKTISTMQEGKEPYPL